MITTAFSGFLRYDELNSIDCNDLSIQQEYFTINITKSKNDQYRAGNQVLIAKGSTSACPYNMMLRYLSVASISTESKHFLFKPAFRSKGVSELITKDKQLSYTRARECIVKLLSSVAPERDFGLHSLRSGGATAAANTDIGGRCLKRHGRWRRDESRDGYIEDSLEKRLRVTQSLGL